MTSYQKKSYRTNWEIYSPNTKQNGFKRTSRQGFFPTVGIVFAICLKWMFRSFKSLSVNIYLTQYWNNTGILPSSSFVFCRLFFQHFVDFETKFVELFRFWKALFCSLLVKFAADLLANQNARKLIWCAKVILMFNIFWIILLLTFIYRNI
jgi:hypothetical protein